MALLDIQCQQCDRPPLGSQEIEDENKACFWPDMAMNEVFTHLACVTAHGVNKCGEEGLFVVPWRRWHWSIEWWEAIRNTKNVGHSGSLRSEAEESMKTRLLSPSELHATLFCISKTSIHPQFADFNGRKNWCTYQPKSSASKVNYNVCINKSTQIMTFVVCLMKRSYNIKEITQDS